MVSRIALMAGLVLALGAGAALAQDHGSAPAAAPKAGEAVIGPTPNPAHPKGGYLKTPAGSLRLIDKEWKDASGLPLYVLDRRCDGQCAVLFPPLTPAKDAKPAKDWKIIVREENGDRQWVYKGKPVYTYVNDQADVHPQADGVLPEIKLARP